MALLVSSIALLAAGCSSDDQSSGARFSDGEWALVQQLSPVPELPDDPTNAHADDDAAAELGQALFFETSYSGPLVVGDDGMNGGLGAEGEPGKVGCVSCHQPDRWFMDKRSNPNNVSLGVGYTARNAPSLVNVAFYQFYGWGMKQDTLWTQAAGSPESRDNTAGNRLEYAHMLYQKYREAYDAVFEPPLDPALDPSAPDAARFPPKGRPKSNESDPDGPWEMMAAEDREIVMRIMSNVGKAIEAYERRLVSRDAPFDRFVAGDESAISESAKRGLKLFIGKAACIECHSDPTFTDNEPHNTGVPQIGPNVPEMDTGHFADASLMLANKYNGASQYSDDPEGGAARLEAISADAANTGAFRTKSLRHVEHTGPYMHNGSISTLEEVIEFYDRGGGDGGFAGTKDPLLVPLNLSSAERADLVAFLKTLTGEPVPVELTTAPNP